ncbi:hypothetical protein B0H14DRAFT_3754248, partial [Mycena olivaceomarginata]
KPHCGTLSGGVPLDVNVGLGPMSTYKTIVAFGGLFRFYPAVVNIDLNIRIDSYTAGATNGPTWVQNFADSTGAKLVNYAVSG